MKVMVMRKHGQRYTPTYMSWINMRQRCQNVNDSSYDRYGGRGIKVDPAWDDFEVFLRDMGPRPEGCTIDRKDVNGHYCKDNCRWLTNKEQLRNTRVNRMLTFQGRTACVSQWAEELGLKNGTVLARLNRGWSVERALTSDLVLKQPGVVRNQKLYMLDGQTRNLKDWARHRGLNYGTLNSRIKSGWSVEKAIKTPTDPRYRRDSS